MIDELAPRRTAGIDAILAIHQRLQTIREILSDCLGESGVPEMEQLQKTVGIVAGALPDNRYFVLSRVPRGECRE